MAKRSRWRGAVAGGGGLHGRGACTDPTSSCQEDLAETLRRREDTLRAFIEQSSQGVALLDEDGVVLEWNTAMADLSGLPSGQVLGRALGDLMPLMMAAERFSEGASTRMQLMIRTILQAEASGLQEPLEVMVHHPDGSRRIATLSIFRVRTSRGFLLGVISTDMTARREAERAAHEQSERFQAFVEQSVDGIILIDEHGAVAGWNPAIAKLTGVPRHEALGRPIWEVTRLTAPPELQSDTASEHLRAFVLEAIASGAVPSATRLEWPLVPRGGKQRIASQIFFPLHTGRGTWLGAIVSDVTARRAAETALRNSEERFRTLIEQSTEGVTIIGPQGRIAEWNRALEDLSGIPRAEALGQPYWDVVYQLAVPGHRTEALRETLRTRVLHALEIGAMPTIRSTEIEIETRGGQRRFLTQSSFLVRSSQGNSIASTVVDVTGPRQARIDRAKLEDQLRHAQRLESVGRLAGGIAHDFNNLLTGIRGNLELALLDAAPEDPGQAFLAEASSATDAAASLVRQLLAFSRQQLLEPRVVDLNRLIRDMGTMLRRLIGEDIDLRIETDPDLGRIKVDPGQAEQLVVNLAINARDAMPHGGVLTIRTANLDLAEAGCAALPGARPGRHVLLSIRDTGVGLSDEAREHLFEPFFTTKPVGKGTGLGLSTVYGVVQQHGGAIDFESRRGEGTTFRIYLPRTDEDESRPPASAYPKLPGGRETILLVEDDRLVRQTARRILSRLGYAVQEHANGEAALASLRADPGAIDLLLTDIVMCGINGHEVAHRAREIRPDLKVIFASGYSDDVIGRHGMLQHGLHLLHKPYTMQALARKIREVLDDG